MTLPCGPGFAIAHIAISNPLVSVCCACACVAGYLALAEPAYEGPMISITFDDQYAAVADAYKLMSLRNMTGTVYVYTQEMMNSNLSLSVLELQGMLANGWEVGSHSISHQAMTEMEDATQWHELAFSKDYIEEVLGHPVYSFSSPYGNFDENLISKAETIYDTHVNAFSDAEGVNTVEGFDPYNIHRFDVLNPESAETVCAKINAVDEDEWLVLLFHNFTDDMSTLQDDELWVYDIAEFEKILECIDASGASVVNVTQGADIMTYRQP